MYFDSDAEFEDFCVAPFATVKETKSGVPYIGGNYSDEYLKCLKSGVRFIIRDTESAIYERQCVCKRVPVIHNGKPLGHDYLVQLNVENLEPYQ